ncbi:MAG: pyridoxal-phosphate dependent enzyme [Anaerolineales bacterium]|jgi:threonine synthase|nr:pyridoxal-phosphate dependent enzyme [Anaerolineales bacterium]
MIDFVHCTNCRKPYPEQGTPYRCPICGGLFDFQSFPAYHPDKVDPSAPGIWRYAHAFGLPAEAPVISLGEGNTPLVWAEFFGRQVALKCEYLNPSGSFKDRGSALIVSFLRSRGVQEAVEDSSGNAGASFAAYAARASINASVFVPQSASGPKRTQIQAYGADLVPVEGPRSNAAAAVCKAAEGGSAYASHAYLPFNLPGYATAAYELVSQLGMAPGTVIVPVGQGGFMLGLLRGFRSLMAAGVIRSIPKIIGVQAIACAPLWALACYGADGLRFVGEGETLAEGIRVLRPLRGDTVLQEVEANHGMFMAVEEQEIREGRISLAHQGFYVEYTSAVAWASLKQLVQRSAAIQDPVVLLLTGSGLKNL